MAITVNNGGRTGHAAYNANMSRKWIVRLGEICQRLDVSVRDARYVLEQGHVPKGVNQAPASGNHRHFELEQAFWLAMVLKLKAIGVKTPLAARIADYADRSFRVVNENANSGQSLLSRVRQVESVRQFYLDVGDLEWVRLVTDANPAACGPIEAFEWRHVERPNTRITEFRPCAVIRLDLTQIARLLTDRLPADKILDNSR